MNILLVAIMSSLKEIGRTHPLATATVGATSGLGSALVGWMQSAAPVFQFVSVLFGSLVAIGAFLLATPKVIRLLRNAWIKRSIVNADRDSEPPFPPINQG